MSPALRVWVAGAWLTLFVFAMAGSAESRRSGASYHPPTLEPSFKVPEIRGKSLQ
jgi:hypothetical protein